jgi:hypothetical protein
LLAQDYHVAVDQGLTQEERVQVRGTPSAY